MDSSEEAVVDDVVDSGEVDDDGGTDSENGVASADTGLARAAMMLKFRRAPEVSAQALYAMESHWRAVAKKSVSTYFQR